MTTTRRATLQAGLAALALPLRTLAAGERFTVGYIYVGSKNDQGYNQSHASAAAQLAGVAGVRVVEQENVPESSAVASVMEAMIVEEGAGLVYPTSWGYYDPHVLDVARRYPQVYFRHCGGAWQPGDPANVGSYLGHMHEGQFLAGIAAGEVAAGAPLGFVAAFRYPSLLRNVNAFMLGAQRADPQASLQLVFTGSWSDPVKEAEAVNALADRGCKVFGCSVDSGRTIVETARRRGLHACGYNSSTAALGGEAYLTSPVASWATLNLRTLAQVRAGEAPPNFFSGGVAEGIVTVDDAYGPAMRGTAAKMVAAARRGLQDGGLKIWTGPLRDNEGKLRAAAGELIEREDVRLRKMDWFVSGVVS